MAEGVREDFGDQNEAVELQQQLAASSRMKTTFRGLKVFVSREVPLRPVYFVLLCGGVAEVGWERGAGAGHSAGHGSAFGVEGEAITHQLVDRPVGSFEQRQGREYVQPQWVFDSFNIGASKRLIIGLIGFKAMNLWPWRLPPADLALRAGPQPAAPPVTLCGRPGGGLRAAAAGGPGPLRRGGLGAAGAERGEGGRRHGHRHGAALRGGASSELVTVSIFKRFEWHIHIPSFSL